MIDHYLTLADQWLTRAAIHHAANEASMGQTAAAIGNGFGALAHACATAEIDDNGPLTLPSLTNPAAAPTLVQPGQGPAVAAPMTTTPEVTA